MKASRNKGDHLPGRAVTTVIAEGWGSVKNGSLLALIEETGFDTFITADKNLDAQQNLRGRPFGILVLSTNHWPSMKPHVRKLSSALDHCEVGTVTKLDCGLFVPERRRKPI